MASEYAPTESAEQTALMRWAFYESGKWPELRMLFHIPNEGKRSYQTGAKMRGEGMKKGVPDLCLPVARGEYHGLYIEMKRQSGSGPTEEQLQWMVDLSREGYAVCWCRGWEKAAGVIKGYLEGKGMEYTKARGRAGEFLAGE